MMTDALRQLEKSLAKDNPAFAQLLRERDARPSGGPHEELIGVMLEAIAPVIKRHVAREIRRATAPLIARIARFESEQRGPKRRKPVKLLGRRPVKCLTSPERRVKPVKCFEPAKRRAPVRCLF
jgi:hypothetical protein